MSKMEVVEENDAKPLSQVPNTADGNDMKDDAPVDASAEAAARLADKKNKACFAFRESGTCKRGAECHFSHEIDIILTSLNRRQPRSRKHEFNPFRNHPHAQRNMMGPGGMMPGPYGPPPHHGHPYAPHPYSYYPHPYPPYSFDPSMGYPMPAGPGGVASSEQNGTRIITPKKSKKKKQKKNKSPQDDADVEAGGGGVPADESEQSPRKKKKVKVEVVLATCDACEKTLAPTPYASHIVGKAHLKKVQQLLAAAQFSCRCCSLIFKTEERETEHKDSLSHIERENNPAPPRVSAAQPSHVGPLAASLNVHPSDPHATRCHLCNVDYESAMSKEAHLQGKKHKKAMNAALDPAVAQANENKTVVARCELCKIDFTQQIQHTQHITGKRHHKSVAKAQLPAQNQRRGGRESQFGGPPQFRSLRGNRRGSGPRRGNSNRGGGGGGYNNPNNMSSWGRRSAPPPHPQHAVQQHAQQQQAQQNYNYPQDSWSMGAGGGVGGGGDVWGNQQYTQTPAVATQQYQQPEQQQQQQQQGGGYGGFAYNTEAAGGQQAVGADLSQQYIVGGGY